MDPSPPAGKTQKVDGHEFFQPIKTYVLRAGRMTEAQKKAIEELGGTYILPFSQERIELASLFPRVKPVIMEIGFGMGGATWQIALNRADYNYLGVEVHSPGVGRLLIELQARRITNLKIVQHDALEVLDKMIAPQALGGLHIFYPDPWPKKRHHKRRIMRREVIDLMASRLAPGAYLYFVTDIEEYGISTLEVLENCKVLRNAYRGFSPRMQWRPETKFESRASRESRPAFELYFTKV